MITAREARSKTEETIEKNSNDMTNFFDAIVSEIDQRIEAESFYIFDVISVLRKRNVIGLCYDEEKIEKLLKEFKKFGYKIIFKYNDHNEVKRIELRWDKEEEEGPQEINEEKQV